MPYAEEQLAEFKWCLGIGVFKPGYSPWHLGSHAEPQKRLVEIAKRSITKALCAPDPRLIAVCDIGPPDTADDAVGAYLATDLIKLAFAEGHEHESICWAVYAMIEEESLWADLARNAQAPDPLLPDTAPPQEGPDPLLDEDDSVRKTFAIAFHRMKPVTWLLVVAAKPNLCEEWTAACGEAVQATRSEVESRATRPYVARPLGHDIKKKRSTTHGQAYTLILGKLLEHHGYDHGDGLISNESPMVGPRKFARLMGGDKRGESCVSSASISNFFRDHFGGYLAYVGLCDKNKKKIGEKLKSLAEEYASIRTFGKNPPGEGNADDDK